MSFCSLDQDCPSQNYCNDGQCSHISLGHFQPIHILAYVMISIISGLQNIGGLGAGPCKIFVFILTLNYSLTESTFVTHPIILGGKLADLYLTKFRSHPLDNERPVIDYDLSLLLIPNAILGSSMGTLITTYLSNFNQGVFLIILTAVAFYFTWKKTKEKMKEEMKQNQQKSQIQDQITAEKNKEIEMSSQQKKEIKLDDSLNKSIEIRLNNNTNRDLVSNTQFSNINSDTHQNKEGFLPQENEQKEKDQKHQNQQQIASQQEQKYDLYSPNKLKIAEKKTTFEQSELIQTEDPLVRKYKQLLIEDRQKFPLKKIGLIILLLLFLFIVFISLQKEVSGIAKCSATYWLIFITQFPINLIFCCIIKRLITKQQQIKEQNHHKFKESDINYSKITFMKIYFPALIAGFVNGIAGFGNSLILVPWIVQLGFHPRIATQTGSYISFFVSAVAIIITLISGKTKLDTFIILFIISFFGGAFITYLLNKLIDFFKLQTATIAFTVFIQAVLCLSFFGQLISDVTTQPWEKVTSYSPFCK